LWGGTGGSTEEAQFAIGGEVGTALVRFLKTGSTLGAVNFPEVELRLPAVSAADKFKYVRVTNCHQNVPGVLKVREVFFFSFHWLC
jgi:D-3-phosphoglycerate dehydrogenase / 2-oxoglutarate reductase